MTLKTRPPSPHSQPLLAWDPQPARQTPIYHLDTRALVTNICPSPEPLLHLFFPLPFLDLAPAFDADDATLEALDGAAELALLDLTLSRALFCDDC